MILRLPCTIANDAVQLGLQGFIYIETFVKGGVQFLQQKVSVTIPK